MSQVLWFRGEGRACVDDLVHLTEACVHIKRTLQDLPSFHLSLSLQTRLFVTFEPGCLLPSFGALCLTGTLMEGAICVGSSCYVRLS